MNSTELGSDTCTVTLGEYGQVVSIRSVAGGATVASFSFDMPSVSLTAEGHLILDYYLRKLVRNFRIENHGRFLWSSVKF